MASGMKYAFVYELRAISMYHNNRKLLFLHFKQLQLHFYAFHRDCQTHSIYHTLINQVNKTSKDDEPLYRSIAGTSR